VRRIHRFLRRYWALAALPLLLATALPVSAQVPGTIGGRGGRRSSISGTIHDANSHNPLEGARVDMRAPNGSVVNTVFTSSTGTFQFDDLRNGNYTVSFTADGYEQSMQEVTVEGGPIMGLDIALRRLDAADAKSATGNTVSAHELAVPSKARDAKDKGMSLLYDKSDYKGAIAEFERALKIDPGYYEASLQIGIAYSRLGDNAAAEQSLHKTLTMNPNYGDAYGALALILCNEKKFADAEPVARKAVELDPGSWEGNYELGRALYGLDRSDEAEASVQAAIKINPGDGPMHLLLANIHVKLHNYPALLDDLNAYLKITPTGAAADQARQLREKIQQALAKSEAAPAESPGPQP
jgi:Tfp pilus assembly protein PilF